VTHKHRNHNAGSDRPETVGYEGVAADTRPSAHVIGSALRRVALSQLAGQSTATFAVSLVEQRVDNTYL
jgi:hypothetical protein